MNSSKSLVSLRRPLYDRTNTYYNNTIEQQHMSKPYKEVHLRKPLNNFVCCKEGTVLKSNDYCGNCSECGLFIILNVKITTSNNCSSVV